MQLFTHLPIPFGLFASLVVQATLPLSALADEGGGPLTVTLAGIERTQLDDYYVSEPVGVTPSLPDQSLPLALDTAVNAHYVAGMLGLTPPEVGRLWANGFVVYRPTAGPLSRLDDLAFVYNHMTHIGVPNFITSDTMLHLYHVQFDEILKNVEEREFLPDIRIATQALLETSVAQYEAFTGEMKEAARRNAAFFAVALKLLDPAAQPPALVAQEVAAELARIEAHAGFAPSPIFIYDEDYSQYVPRGHYTRSEGLERYFKAMMWYGRIGFLLKGCEPACQFCPCFISEQDARIQTIQAALITIALDTLETGGRSVGAIWDRIYAVTAYFVGFADDLTPYDYLDAIRAVFGSTFEVTELADPQRLFDLKAELALLPNPLIYGGTGQCWITPPITPEGLDECLAKSKGLRFMGQRFVPDSYMMQYLVAPVVGPYLGTGEPFTMCSTGAGLMRCFPRGLDVMALLGSAEAVAILEREDDTNYLGYAEAFGELSAFFDSLSESDWNRNLYWSWLYTLKSLLADGSEGCPAFMSSPAWKRKQLNAALASWAELRHDTILYAKQSTTPGFTSQPPPPDHGYVEPVPEAFHRLGALTRMTRLGLSDLGVLEGIESNRLGALEQILDRLTRIAIAELEAGPVTEADYDFIERFGDELEAVLAGVSTGAGEPTIIADVHTDINTASVLEEGVGYFDVTVVAYPTPDGRLLLGAGPVFSYYEFKWPMSDRLTDEQWKQMLEDGEAPEPPPWTAAFTATGMVGTVSADFDGDGDVDPSDFGLFQRCVTGPSLGPPALGCSPSDFDGDRDIDQVDFGVFQRCFSGANNPANPNCAK